ncbi:MAG: DUF4265 domain-containing protein [Archangium sp.]|nr:DUF4265 domain-containing protein [Archangium sp.]MDP3571836.1 DUF4265 domain-containing protein [Archangium sp.]
MSEVVLLFAGSRKNGSPVQEEVVLERLGGDRFRVVQSPGLVLGIAAGDVITVDGDRPTVVVRGGNLCVQIFSIADIARIEPVATERLRGLGGYLDGSAEKELVFTLPLTAGWQNIERVLNEVVAQFPGAEWLYGNVYDAVDGVTPLNWWVKPTS